MKERAMTTNQNNSNNAPVFIREAQEAGKALTSMSKNEGKAEALAIHALFEAWPTYDWSYTVKRRGDEEDNYTATLEEMDINTVNADGSTDSKRMSTRFASLLSQLFGVVDANNAQQAVIRRAIISARYLRQSGAPCTLDSKGNLQTSKGSVIALPADATDNEKADYEETKDKVRSLDGKNGFSLRELNKRAADACPPRNRKARKAKTTEPVDAAKSLLASAKFITATLTSAAKPNGESEIAFTEDMRKTLYAMTVAANAYFASDPVEQEDKTAKSKAA
jgi:hypothetical protein